MLSTDFVPSQIEQIRYCGMHTQESSSLPRWFKPSHHPLPHPGRLVWLFSAIIGIPISDVDHLRDYLSLGDRIAAQFVCHDLPRFATVWSGQSPEESLRSSPIALGLQININYFTILIHGSPEIVLLAVDSDKDLVDIEGIAIPTMLSLQSPSI